MGRFTELTVKVRELNDIIQNNELEGSDLKRIVAERLKSVKDAQSILASKTVSETELSAGKKILPA